MATMPQGHRTLGSYLKEAREEKARLQQKEAARLAGVTAAFLCQVEKGKKKPTDAMLRRLASIYGMQPDELFRLIGRPPLITYESLLAPPPSTPPLLKADPLSTLEPEEREELTKHLAYLRWKKRVTAH